MTFAAESTHDVKQRVSAVIRVDGIIWHEALSQDFNLWLFELSQELKAHRRQKF